jgi:2-C-methyl-D-erythritol 4-phosphate cytidylyltransferase
MAKGIGVIIPAAGAGNRLGRVSKPLIEMGGRPLISRILDLFRKLRGLKKIYLAVPGEAIHMFAEIVKAMELNGLVEIVEGGEMRAISVRNAYEKLRGHINDDDLVCVHDAARPLLSESDLDSVIAAGWKYGAAFLALKAKDTLKFVDAEHFCTRTIDRSNIYCAQTPQVMLSRFLSQAYKTSLDISKATDEIMLLEGAGVKVFVVEPEHLNLKLTTPEDLELIKKLISG